MGVDVPYDPTFYRCEAVLVDGPWPVNGNISFGILNAEYEITCMSPFLILTQVDDL